MFWNQSGTSKNFQRDLGLGWSNKLVLRQEFHQDNLDLHQGESHSDAGPWTWTEWQELVRVTGVFDRTSESRGIELLRVGPNIRISMQKILCTYWLSGRAGWENIWLQVMAYGPSAASYYLCFNRTSCGKKTFLLNYVVSSKIIVSSQNIDLEQKCRPIENPTYLYQQPSLFSPSICQTIPRSLKPFLSFSLHWKSDLVSCGYASNLHRA